MKKIFKKGDKVITNTHAVYEPTQESLSNLKGTIVEVFDYPDNIHVEVQIKSGKKVVLEFSIDELNKIK